MIKLLRYWNQNKRKIIITIAVIAFVFIIIQVANQIVKKQNADKINNNRTVIKKVNTIGLITKKVTKLIAV